MSSSSSSVLDLDSSIKNVDDIKNNQIKNGPIEETPEKKDYLENIDDLINKLHSLKKDKESKTNGSES